MIKGSIGATIALAQEELLYKKSFMRYLIPSVISLLFCQIAPFVDALSVSFAIGEAALAAIGVITPLYYLMNIPAAMAGIGGGILLSTLAGSGQREMTGAVFTRSMIFVLLSAVGLTALGLIFLEPMVDFLGAVPENTEYALDYCRVLLLGMPFYITCFAGAYFLANDNAPNLAMWGTIASNLTNCIIDVLFINLWGYGIEAAAWGTVVGEMVSCVIYAFHFLRKERLCRWDFATSLQDIKLFAIVQDGIPEAVKYLLFFVQLWISNYLMGQYDGVAGLADAALIANLLLVITIFMEGVSEPVIPLTAGLYGENNQSGVLLIKKIASRISIYILLPVTILFCIYPMWFPQIFSITDPEVLAAMPTSLRITSLSFIFSCFNLIIINSCVSSGKYKVALVGIILRTLCIHVPCALLMLQLDPGNAPWYANLFAEIGTLAFFYYKGECKGLFHSYSENYKLLLGGVLSAENLQKWQETVSQSVEKRYQYLLEKAFFAPLSLTLADGVSFPLTISVLDNQEENQGDSLVLRYDSKIDMLYPSVKNGFLVDEQCSLRRRMINTLQLTTGAEEQTVVIIAPECYSGKRLVESAREAGHRVVLATATPAEQYAKLRDDLMIDECQRDGLCDRVIIRDTLEELVECLQTTESNIIAVIPGSEFSVEVAEPLAEILGVRGNPSNSTAQRRNKYAMKMAIKAAGLDHARGGNFTDLTSALAFVDEQLEFPLFIKPPEGAGSENVFKCRNREDFIEKFNIVLQAPDAYEKMDGSVVVEEFLDGDEYAVNIFGDEDKILVTSIWKYEKISNEFADNLYWNDILVDLNDPYYADLKEYAVALYKAVGIQWGPGHAEIKLTKRGPIAIEIGARLMGSANETYTMIGTHIDSPLETLKVFKTGRSDVPAKPVLYEHLALVNLPFVVQGRLKKIHGLEEIRQMPGYFTEELPIEIGDMIEPSRNLTMTTCGIWLRGESLGEIEEQCAKIHEIFSLEVE